MTSFGEKVRELRTAKGLTLRQLAARLDAIERYRAVLR